MSALITRNLLLYFRDRPGILFSLLGAFISFVLYLIFLKETMAEDWSKISQTNQLLDTWLISGTLTITGITTTLSSLSQRIKDRESQVDQDLSLTDISGLRLRLSYLLSAAFIGTIMQILLFSVMFTYFYFTNQTVFYWQQLPAILFLMIFSSLLAAVLNDLMIQSIKTVDNVGKFATIVGTAAGFLVGTYVPIGALPSFAQTLMKLTPGSYIASLYRQILLSPTLTDTFKGSSSAREQFTEFMGVRLRLSQLLTFQQTYIILVGILIIALFLVLFPQWLKNYKKQQRLFR
ncbi:MAG: ABC transporter permease [Tetragenococcus koreensis]|nr:ABC transporter permease [Tetragenococcus koreensis]